MMFNKTEPSDIRGASGSYLHIFMLLMPCLGFVPNVLAGAETSTDIQVSQQAVSDFASRVNDGLGLGARTGLFSARAGNVQGTYLANQGILLEVSTPLGTSRPGMNIDAVNTSLQQLSGQLAGLMEAREFMELSRPDIEAMRESMALSLRRDETAEYFREFNNRLAEMSLFQDAEAALRAAAQSARSLHANGQVDNERFSQLNHEVRAMREQLSEQLQELSILRTDLRRRSAEVLAEANTVTEEQRAEWQSRLQAMVEKMEPLRQSAMLKAEELQALREETQRANALQWEQQLLEFEARLFALLCQDTEGLAAIPDGQHLTLMLPGLGAEMGNGLRSKRIHVVSRAELSHCQAGDISAAQLSDRAATYSF